MHKFVYGTFRCEYKREISSRKTISLTVMPDMSIIVRCPQKVDDTRIEIFLQKKWLWIEKQLHFFKKFQKRAYKKEYISGESFLYLGRQYQLIVKHAKEDRVVLQNGKLLVYTMQSATDGVCTRLLLTKWYRKRSREVFHERYEEMLKKFSYSKPLRLRVKKMPKRWGSYMKGEYIALNPLLIHASKDCIDYVITHELCHMKYKNHDKRFYDLLNAKYPRWEKVKEKLELRMI